MSVVTRQPYHCRHLFGDGHQCGSPAMRGEVLCYNHLAIRRPQQYQTIHGHTSVALPEPSDLHAVQRGLAELLRLTLAGTIDAVQSARAHTILASASRNLARIDRQTATLLKANPGRTPVTDLVQDPVHGTLAPAPLTEAGIPEAPEPRPEGPIPSPVTLFTLPAHRKNVETEATAASYEAFNLRRLRMLARDIDERRRRFEGLPLAIQVEEDQKTLEMYPDLQTYLQKNEDLGPAGNLIADPDEASTDDHEDQEDLNLDLDLATLEDDPTQSPDPNDPAEQVINFFAYMRATQLPQPTL